MNREPDPPSKPTSPRLDPKAERETKLGEALRANLRRRKAPASPSGPERA